MLQNFYGKVVQPPLADGYYYRARSSAIGYLNFFLICPSMKNGMTCSAHNAMLTAIKPTYKTLATGQRSPVVIAKNGFYGKDADGCRPLTDSGRYSRTGAALLLLVLLITAAVPAHSRDKTVLQYGAGLIVNIPLPEPEVEQAVQDVVQNTIIRGTKEYNKDEYISKAVAATSTPVFPTWNQAGKVYYKVREQAINPWNFKDSADVGTLAVRYIVQPQGDNNTVLRIDAIYVENFRACLSSLQRLRRKR